MQLSFTTPIWLYPMPVDFRRQLDGLVILVADSLSKDPCSGELFIFRNKGADKVRLLWYDRNGFWLCYKRLEKGKFIFPQHELAVCELTRDQLSWLLSGLNFQTNKLLPAVRSTQFF
jgi:transposase